MDAVQGQNLQSGIGGVIGGLLGLFNDPYRAASGEYEKFGQRAINAQNPFYSAGTNAIQPYQNWVSGQSNPADFINNLMGKYQQSPWAKYQQEQSTRAAQNLGSATGLTGSTPLQMQAQQNAQNISQEDMSRWLQQVLGINTNYGAGLNNLLNYGSTAGNNISNLWSKLGENEAEASYGSAANENQGWGNLLGGGIQLASMFL